LKVFKDYSQYYDLLYSDKDYSKEANYIFDLIKKFKPSAKTVLELGCGTGKHAKLLSEKELNIHGIDISKTMLDQAIKMQNNSLSFCAGDVRNYRSSMHFDTVISLFHVASYQITNSDLKKYFETVSTHLNSGGIFIFDAWYGPAVLNQKPENRTKNFENEFLKIQRKASSIMKHNENIVDVNYEILVTNKSNMESKILNETHKMRYLFKPELENMLDSSGLKLIHTEEWITGREIGIDSWGACFVATRK
jgi:trans-aconitate methyltransferase